MSKTTVTKQPTSLTPAEAAERLGITVGQLWCAIFARGQVVATVKGDVIHVKLNDADIEAAKAVQS
jgi:hypothetical protein